MDSIIIKQLVTRQLEENSFRDCKQVYILEKDWGYAVEITFENTLEYFNELFDRVGNVIYSLGSFGYDTGEIYGTEVQEKTDDDGRNHTLVHAPDVRFKQLDDNHFIIPRIDGSVVGNALFFVDESNQVTYKGFIRGRIRGNILTQNKKLIEQKCVLVCETIDETRDEYDNYFYSWDKNCRTSDKWNLLYSSESLFSVKDFLYNSMNDLPKELVNEIIRYMQENEAWLAALKIIPKDNRNERYFISLIGNNGLPLVDLTYITPTYEVKTYPLRKEEIGEVDDIRQSLKEKMEQRVLGIQENKRNIAANFFRMTGLTMNESSTLIDEKEKQKQKEKQFL